MDLIWKKGRTLLRKQRFDARYVRGGRAAFKAHHGSNADYYHIYTDNSLKAHLSALKRFAAYCADNEIKRLMDITTSDIGNYALYLQNHEHLSAWTVKNHIMMINHLLIGAHLRDESAAFHATYWNSTHEDDEQINAKRRVDISHNRAETAQQWREAHQRAYQNHQAMLDTERAFGLRRAEITKVDPAKPSIIADCFFKHDHDYYCLVVKGKGGRPRLATCRRDLQNEMQQLYHFHKLKQLPQTMAEMKRFTNYFMKKHEVDYRKDHYLYHTNIARVKNHINRREYAQVRLHDLDQTMAGTGKQHTINGVKDYENRFLQLARDLGHNRIGILGNYLGK